MYGRLQCLVGGADVYQVLFGFITTRVQPYKAEQHSRVVRRHL